MQVFIIIHVVALVYYIKGILSPKMFKVAVTLVVSIGMYAFLYCFSLHVYNYHTLIRGVYLLLIQLHTASTDGITSRFPGLCIMG